MVAVWSALIGAAGALLAVWGTQWLTTKRETRRDAVRWAQERQQRTWDAQRAAFAEALLALDRWHSHAVGLIAHLPFNAFRQQNTARLPDLEEAARSGLVAVELVCSEHAVEATREAFNAVGGLTFAVNLTLADSGVDEGLRHQANSHASTATDAMIELRKVYRTELARLSAEPLLPEAPGRRQVEQR